MAAMTNIKAIHKRDPKVVSLKTLILFYKLQFSSIFTALISLHTENAVKTIYISCRLALYQKITLKLKKNKFSQNGSSFLKLSWGQTWVI